MQAGLGSLRLASFGARRRLKRLGVAAGLALVLALSPLNPSLAGIYSPHAQAQASLAAGQQAPDLGPVRILTLVTGDRVVMAGDGALKSYLPAPNRPDHGYIAQRFNGHTRVIPRDVLPLVPRVLDPSLFDITTILAERGDDQASTTVPIIVQGGASNASRRSATASSVGNTLALPSINAVGLKLSKAQAQDLGARLAAGASQLPAHAGMASRAAASLPTKIWLDRKAKASWDVNLEQIHAPQAWAKGFTGKGTTIAVLDTGIDDKHPDLVGRVSATKNFTADPTAEDFFGHGTHVASTAAGTGAANQGQRKGVAYEAKLLNAKVLDNEGSGDFSQIIAGVQWAGQQKATVANLSIQSDVSDGTDPLSQAIDATTKSSGTLFVVAAGNFGKAESIGSPAAAEQALTVGAVDSSDELAYFSSYGPRLRGGIKPEITAPGVDILAARTTKQGPGDPYISMSGTSMATPHVAGAAAVVRAAHPSWTPAQVKAALASTGVENPKLSVNQQGDGRLDLTAALGNTVIPSSSTLDFGVFPAGKAHPPVSKTLTYTNTSSKPVTVNLSVKTSNPAAAKVVRVSPASLSVPAGKTATATVKASVDAVNELGLMDGEVVATPTGNNAGVDVADGVGFTADKQPKRHQLTVKVINADGTPDQWSWAYLFDVHDMTRGFRADNLQFNAQGVATLDVPEGTYQLESVSSLYNERGEQAPSTWMINPELAIKGDTLVVFDARQAKPVTAGVAGRTTQTGSLQVVEKRTDAAGQQFSTAQVSTSDMVQLRTNAQSAQPVSVGSWNSYLVARAQAPQLTFNAAGLPALNPYAAYGASLYVGNATVPVVAAGTGSVADFSKVKAEGAVAVVTRSALPVEDVMANAAVEKVALVVLANDVDVPWTTNYYANEMVSLPLVTLRSSEGTALARLTSVQVSGLAVPSPRYTSVHSAVSRLPASVSLTAEQVGHMAVVDEAVVPPNGKPVSRDPAFAPYVSHQRAPIVAGFAPMPTTPIATPVGARWIEYVQPGLWFSEVYWFQGPGQLTVTSPARMEQADSKRMQTWLRAPLRTQPLHSSVDGHMPAATRTAQQMSFALTGFADSSGQPVSYTSYEGASPVDSTYTLRRDGTAVGTRTGPEVSFDVPEKSGRYELRYDAALRLGWANFASTTTWGFTSAAPTGPHTALPLLNIGLDLPLDLRNTLVGTKGSVRLTVPFGTLPPQQCSIEVATSTDGGKTWKRATTSPVEGDRATVSLPRAPANTTVSLMITGKAGSLTVKQTLVNSLRTPPAK